MHLLFVLLCVAGAKGGFLRDLISPRGWHLGDGVVLHLTDSRYPNSTFLERHSIVMDYGGYGVSVSKVPSRRALEVDLYAAGDGARALKNSMFHLIIGYKMAAVAAIALSAVGALVLKALIAAKLSAILSVILLISKLFSTEKTETSKYVEIEPPTEYVEASGPDYYPTGSSSHYTYADYVPGIDYASQTTNGTIPGAPGNQQVARRRAGLKRRKVPLLTIQHSVKS